MKLYTVLLYYKANEFDIRIRSDIDDHPSFKRTDDGRVIHTRSRTGNVRTFTIVYEGSQHNAKMFGMSVKLFYKGLGVVRSIMDRFVDDQ